MYGNANPKTTQCSAKQPIAEDILKSLANLETLADKVKDFCYSKLAPIILEKEEKTCLPEKIVMVPYPPLFLEYRNKICIIEQSLLHIERMLQATEI